MDQSTPAGKNFASSDFAIAPYIAIWEVTRACDLACVHCRAEAIAARHPDELSTEEGLRLLDQIRSFGQPLMVLTGGDPLKRPDIFDFIEYGSKLGLRMTMTPSGTPLLTRHALEHCQDRGLMRLAVSLDGSTARRHDAFRQVSGSYDWTIKALLMAQDIGLPTQVNTTVTRHNLDDIDALVALMSRLEVAMWSVFFLVPTGRGRPEDEVSPKEYERVFEKMYKAAQMNSFDVKSTAAPHYRRYVLQQWKRNRHSSDHQSRLIGMGGTDSVGRARMSVNDANGFVFISHTGEICPSGFLPVAAGNVRVDSLAEVYRNSALFLELRDFARLKGKCGDCDFRSVCGGSRARAFAMTGDYLESDPFCAYVPPAYQRKVDRNEAEAPSDYFDARIKTFPPQA